MSNLPLNHLTFDSIHAIMLLYTNEGVTHCSQSIIYEISDGHSDVRCFLEEFQMMSSTSKDDIFVLLHHFRKKSQKTPQREIDRTISEMHDYLSRKEK